MATWKSFQLTVPGGDLFEKVRSVLETLVTFLEVLKAILDTVKAFLVDFGNPIIALVQALIALIQAFLESLRRTGLYGLYHIPTVTSEDFFEFFGGVDAFLTTFKASLYDTKDANRPRPLAGATQSGFVVIMVDASSVAQLLRRVQQLLAFFGKKSGAPKLRAPLNIRAFPLNQSKDPLLSVASVFSTPPTAIAVEWSLPTDRLPPDPGFRGQITSLVDEFRPPAYLVERTTAQTGDLVTKVVSYTDLRGKVTDQTYIVRETDGRPFRRYVDYHPVTTGSSTATFLLGQLGTFRYIDTNVVKGQTYTYRVRPFLGTLNVDVNNDNIIFPEPREVRAGLRQFVQDYPGENLIMGDPTPEVRASIPDLPGGFDVLGSLRLLFKAAFSLNFHFPLEPTATFDANGFPTGVTSSSEVGRGSLTALANELASLSYVPILGPGVDFVVGEVPPEATQNFDQVGNLVNPPKFPWQTFVVKRKANQLAVTVGEAMLANLGTAQAFAGIMTGPAPKGPLTQGVLAGKTTIQEMVSGLIRDPGSDLPVETLSGAYNLYYVDPVYRLNVLVAISQVASLLQQGSTPNWQRVSIFRDVIPWAGEIFYDILAKIQALVDAYNGALKEIRDFIDLIERKIDALERFLQFLISILDEIESLQVSAYVLNSGVLNGGIDSWVNAVDSAGGNKPPSNPGGYSAGVVLGYVATDAAAFASALKIIFGV